MAHRAGITTAPERRRREWENELGRIRQWEILGTYSTKTAAQNSETNTANSHGCESGQGGAGPEVATWHVYHFYYN